MTTTATEALGSQTRPLDPLTFSFIPRLKNLLPRRQGIPGLSYYQVPVDKARQAQDLGLREVENSLVYTITGPLGSVDCKLYCHGKPIRGLSHQSGRRRLFVHNDVYERTGHLDESRLNALEEQEEETTNGGR